MTRPIEEMMGGFLELELPFFNCFPYPEQEGCAYVSSGRAALDCLLQSRPTPRRVFVPQLACNTLLQPIKRRGLPLVRYQTDSQLRPLLEEDPEEDDLVILIDYFGFLGPELAPFIRSSPALCLVDATTALFAPPICQTPTFYSPRKFVGVPDGGIALAPFRIVLPEVEDVSAERSLHLLQRLESGLPTAFPASEMAEQALQGLPRRMSPLTRRLLQSIDFSDVAAKRIRNYHILHEALRELNRLRLPDQPPSAPFCYPFISGIPGLRDALIDAGIALPLFWPEVIDATPAESEANRMARRLLPLPLDQRYTEEDMQRLVKLILP